MQSCCIQGCESYRKVGTRSIGYFKFPLCNKVLLKKWLKQIGLANWQPSEHDQICSAHFETRDLKFHPVRKYPLLKPSAVPSIFPIRPTCIKQSNNEQNIVDASKQILQLPLQQFQINNKATNGLPLLQSSPVILIPAQINQMTNISQPVVQVPSGGQVTQSKLRKILPKPSPCIFTMFDNIVQPQMNKVPIPKLNNVNVSKTNNIIETTPTTPCASKTGTVKKPILRITINKKYDSSPPPIISESYETVYLPQKNEHNPEYTFIKVKSGNNEVLHNKCDSADNIGTCSPTEPKTRNIKQTNSTSISEQADIIPESVSTKSIDMPWNRESPSTAKLQYLYAKARQDCYQLRKRLKTLHEKQKLEQQEVKKLHSHLAELGRKIQHSYQTNAAEPRGKRKSKFNKNFNNDVDEDEYEELLKEVRRIKQDIKKTRRYSSEHSTQNISHLLNNVMNENSIEESNEENKEENNIRLTVDDGEIIGEISDDCNEVLKDITEDPVVMDLNEDDRSMEFNEEFLDPSLIDG
ncbi:THAP domain-containing protein 5 [Cephus cinctus]|uniref:THAP domain-containing protein 5 n=1 Tax=Cephus cinctus TaxID=211228 RepID=A0AAJ7FF84_CEPCN|nr:THAP domain-containing protein 5 [Cephus cinctus]